MTPYGGAYAAAQQFLEQYPGRAQVEEILDNTGRDYLYVEAEVSGQPIPLGMLGNEMGGMGGGMAPAASPAAPDPGAEMRDLLAERAKGRMSASQRFQQAASKMTSGGGY